LAWWCAAPKFGLVVAGLLYSAYGAAARSQLRQDRLRARHVEPRAGLDGEVLHASVLHDHRIALRAGAHAEAARVEPEADRLGELAVAVGEHAHLARRVVGLSPRAHDEGVVDREADDLVDALGPDRAGLLEEAGQVLQGTGGREGAGHRKQHHALALEHLAH